MASPTTWLITGANRGIGLEFVKQILQNSPEDRVVAGARSTEAPALLSLQEQHGRRLLRVEIDLLKPAALPAAAERVRETFGHLDWLVNNAGFLGHNTDSQYPVALKGAPEEPIEQIEEIFKVNVLGPLLVARAFLPLLLAGQQRKIINITSGAGSLAFHNAVLAKPEVSMFGATGLGYATSKAALNMQTSILANQLKLEGFVVIALHPGIVSTDMGTQGHEILGEELASFGKTITPAESAAAQLSVLKSLKAEQNGKFLSYEGDELPF